MQRSRVTGYWARDAASPTRGDAPPQQRQRDISARLSGAVRACREAEGESGAGGRMGKLMYDPRWLSVFEAWSCAGDSEAPAL